MGTAHGVVLVLIFTLLASATPDDEGPKFHSRWFDWESISESITYSSVIEDIPTRRLEFPKTASETDGWILSGNVADYRLFRPVLSLSIPVPVNLIFIGFDGDGAQSLELERHDFKEWFEHIEHYFRHTIVPVGEEQTTTERYETPSTNIKYRFQFNLIKLHPMVNAVLEDVIMWHLRPEDPNYNPSTAKQNKDSPTRFYVDAFKFSRVLEHLLQSLNLTQSYTLFILNPKSPVEEGEVYGYRSGFSDLEINKIKELQSQWTLSELAPKKETKPEELPDLAKATGSPIQEKQPDNEADKITWSNLVDSSEAWARWFVKSRGAQNVPFCRTEGAEDDPRCISNSQRPERKNILELVKELAVEGTASQKKYLQRIRDGMEHEDCLVDTWIGHTRFGFIDLTAGPFKWGPIVAGQGVRSNTTLPCVPKFSLLKADKENSRGYAVKREESRKKAAINNKVRDALEARKNTNKENSDAGDANDAELELIKGYYAQHCGSSSRRFNDKHNFVNCNFLSEKIKELEKRIQKPNSDESHLFTGSAEEGEGESMVLDNFLGRLGGVISSTLKHIITPPAPLFPAYHTERVTFHFFLISYQNEPLSYFDYEAYKKELLKFKLPNQEFSFVLKEIDISEDRELLMAFQHSLRSAVLPSLNTAGEFMATHVRYIDSKALQYQLEILALHDHEDERLEKEEGITNESGKKKKKEEASQKRHAKDTRSGKGSFSRHIPIFFFSLLSTETPIFIDKYYQAKALSDMVIIVQSPSPAWESRLACNNKPVYWDLRNPLKPALQATMLHYGGLIPTHITYDEANKAASQNWLWSVGDNPLSHTSRGHHFTTTHRDIVLRNFIVNALDDSVEQVNDAIKILLAQTTTLENFRAPIPGMEMTHSYNSIRRNWETVAELVKKFNFEEAIVVSKMIELHAKQFKKMAVQTADILSSIKCKDETLSAKLPQKEGIWHSRSILGASVVFNVLLIALYFAVRGRRTKVKTN